MMCIGYIYICCTHQVSIHTCAHACMIEVTHSMRDGPRAAQQAMGRGEGEQTVRVQ